MMVVYELTAIFESGGNLSFVNPVSWTCLNFSSCSDGKYVTKVHWKLPANKYGILYEGEKCVAHAQYHTYITDMNDAFATQKLKTPRVFQSMMVADRLFKADRPAVTYNNHCGSSSSTKEKTSVDGSLATMNESSANLSSSEDGNLSSNWFDNLPTTLG